ncbi:Low-affinity potassium transport protein [Golovinomyces cichoracearum]|uniref:Low-affinity potassium transport protein n=1 Tax=Golovinomyces cichoracearum TaxID=62708 RepID=A0A420HQ51_9PEZI|nr:Low-affinity potassium transport protein [Golovinomyces cichoracearum]
MAETEPPKRLSNQISQLKSYFRQTRGSVIEYGARAFTKPAFLQLHWTYFLSMSFISSLLFWFLSTTSISYVNSLFMVIGAITGAGLNPVNMSELNLFQQILILGLSMIGNQIVVSIIVIYVRKRAFEMRLKNKRKEEEEERKAASITSSLASCEYSIFHIFYPSPLSTMLTYGFIKKKANLDDNKRIRNVFVSGVQNIISHIIRNHRHRDNTHIDRNSQFHSLSLEERECLRCVEYKSVKFLGYVVIAYYIIWQIYGCIALGAYISYRYPDVAHESGLNPWWIGIYLAVSGFNNSGISLLDSSVVRHPIIHGRNGPVLTNWASAFTGSLQRLFLHPSQWILRQMLNIIPDKEKYQSWRETLQFILKFPRRVYTNLFPSEQTWWLFALLIFFNSFDWVAFEVLNRYSNFIKEIPTKSILLDGLFQTISLRSSGFVVVPIPALFIGLQALYMLMMYISAFPITITMRSSNVYEERSLGIYAREPTSSNDIKKIDGFSDFPLRQRDRFYFVQEQLRRQLSHDLWFLVIGVLVIICTEAPNYNRDPQTFAIFNIIFEIVSAYGCVGFSVGLPNNDASFSGAWHSFSRLALCAIMLRGRHRGLPFDIDKAVQLPGEKMDLAEDQDHQIRAGSKYID